MSDRLKVNRIRYTGCDQYPGLRSVKSGLRRHLLGSQKVCSASAKLGGQLHRCVGQAGQLRLGRFGDRLGDSQAPTERSAATITSVP